MAFHPTLATSLLSFVLAAGFLIMGWRLPPGNLAFPSGIALMGIGLLGVSNFATLRALSQRIAGIERLLNQATDGRAQESEWGALKQSLSDRLDK
jgi:hypothetical protein